MLIAIALAGLQAPAELPSYIQVTGTGTVSTLPDRADIAYSIAGEGKTPDEATAALSNRQKEIVAGIDDLLGGAAKVTTGGADQIHAGSGNAQVTLMSDNVQIWGGSGTISIAPQKDICGCVREPGHVACATLEGWGEGWGCVPRPAVREGLSC